MRLHRKLDPAREKRRHKTALHEAGHVVMLRHQGLPVGDVQISNDGYGGVTSFDLRKHGEAMSMEQRLVYMSGGIAAEEVADPDAKRDGGYRSDHKMATEILAMQGIAPDGLHAAFEATVAESKAVIAARMPELLATAEAIKRGKMRRNLRHHPVEAVRDWYWEGGLRAIRAELKRGWTYHVLLILILVRVWLGG